MSSSTLAPTASNRERSAPTRSIHARSGAPGGGGCWSIQRRNCLIVNTRGQRVAAAPTNFPHVLTSHCQYEIPVSEPAQVSATTTVRRKIDSDLGCDEQTVPGNRSTTVDDKAGRLDDEKPAVGVSARNHFGERGAALVSSADEQHAGLPSRSPVIYRCVSRCQARGILGNSAHAAALSVAAIRGFTVLEVSAADLRPVVAPHTISASSSASGSQ
jgi:hypothetical protein